MMRIWVLVVTCGICDGSLTITADQSTGSKLQSWQDFLTDLTSQDKGLNSEPLLADWGNRDSLRWGDWEREGDILRTGA